MSETYEVGCDCGAVRMTLTGEPRVRGVCHCEDCRELLDVPYHQVTAWEPHQFEVTAGEDALVAFQHPTKRMQRVFCRHCGETLYNTNAMDWRVVSALLVGKRLGGLPAALAPKSHFFYARRVVDVDDDLPRRD